MPNQFLRAATLIVSGATGNGIDLSQFRLTFKIYESDFETPNNAEITVYNLADATAQQIRQMYNGPQQLGSQGNSTVTLQAGYRDGAQGIIFQGQIKQIKIGRENQTDTYIRIFAADADLAYNFGISNTNIPAGTSAAAQAQIHAQQMGLPVGQVQFNFGLNPPNIRGKVCFGMTRYYLRDLANSGQARWSIRGGRLYMTPLNQPPFGPGGIRILNSTTGLIGMPEQTNEGIHVTTLLDPTLQVGSQIQLNQSSIQRASVSVNPTDVNRVEAAYVKSRSIPTPFSRPIMTPCR